MPVSYDASHLLKCTVGMAYSRYFIEQRPRGVIPRFLNALGSRYFIEDRPLDESFQDL